MYDIISIKKNLKEVLSPYRYEHSLMVADEAKKLAKYYGVDEDKAYVAGLLHDMAKDFSDEKNLEYINKYNIDDSFRGKLLHSEIGYYIALEHGYDKEICDAIRYHTLGHAGMDIYAKIVLVADKIGRETKNDIIDEIRKLAYNNLDHAIILYLENLEERLNLKGLNMHVWSLDLLRELKK